MQSAVSMRGANRRLPKLYKGSQKILSSRFHGTPDLRSGIVQASTAFSATPAKSRACCKCCPDVPGTMCCCQVAALRGKQQTSCVTPAGVASGATRGFASSPGKEDFASHEAIARLIANNKKWVAQKTAEDPDFFKRLASVHKPEFFFIACADARYSVTPMLGLDAGQVFTHRNVGNMVMHNDTSMMTSLKYAVEVLKVKHIILCGHYECGAVRAAVARQDHGAIENWIMALKDVERMHRKELEAYKEDTLEYQRRLVELNVQEQCVKLYTNPVVQMNKAAEGGPHIHPMVYDTGRGFIRELDLDFKSILSGLGSIYTVQNGSFPGSP